MSTAIGGGLPRQPPANLEAEQAFLGAMLANNKGYHAVAPFLRPHHFADPLHSRIYAEAERRILAGRIADAVAMMQWYEADPARAEAGPGYLPKLVGATVGITNAKEYARTIFDHWQRRAMVEAAEEMLAGAYGQDGAPGELVARSLAALESVFAGEEERPAVALAEAMDAAMKAADEAARREGPAGVSTGFTSIDERIGGLEDGTLHVLGGRPSMGKSALGWQIAINVARGGAGVLAVSLEMGAVELGRRALAAAAGVPIWLLKRGGMHQGDFERLVETRKELGALPLSIHDGAGLTAAQIDLKARTAKRKHGLGLILIDHLHIVRPEDRDVRQGATWAVGRLSGAMKAMAKQHRCPVLLLAQLNRQVEGRDDKRPGLADLRQTGDIEQDADSVSLLYRAEYYLHGEPEQREGEGAEKFERRIAEWHDRRARAAGKAELIVAKVRDGEPGTVPLLFRASTASFAEAPR